MISFFNVCLVNSLSGVYIISNLKAKSTGTALGSISVFIVSQTAIAAFNKLNVWRITCFPNNVQPTSCSFSVYVTCRFLKIFSKCFFGQLLLSFFVLPLAFKYYIFLYSFCQNFTLPIYISPVEPPQAFHKTLRLHSFATKDLFQKPVSDISPWVKHSLIPFSELSSANKSHNPCPLPFCKMRQLAVSGALCSSSKGFPFFLWRALYYPCVRVPVSLDQRGAEWRPPASAHAPFTLSPTPFH